MYFPVRYYSCISLWEHITTIILINVLEKNAFQHDSKVDNNEIETQSQVSNVYSEENETQSQVLSESSVTLGKKRGRPIKKGDKEWQDEEIDVLIELWGKYECLFNLKHQLYMRKNARAKAIKKIIETLKIEATTKQVQEKLSKLCHYYGAERCKEESWK